MNRNPLEPFREQLHAKLAKLAKLDGEAATTVAGLRFSRVPIPDSNHRAVLESDRNQIRRVQARIQQPQHAKHH